MCKTALGKAKPLVKKSGPKTLFALMYKKYQKFLCWFVSLHLQIWPKLSNSHGLWVPTPCCRCCELRHPLKVLVAFCSPYSTAIMAFFFPASWELGSMETLELYLHSKGKQSKTEFPLSGSLWCDGLPKLQRCSKQVYLGKAPLCFVPANRGHLILSHHVSFLSLLLLDLHFCCWCTDSAEGELFQGWGQFFAHFTCLGNLLGSTHPVLRKTALRRCHPRGADWGGCRNGYCADVGAEICDHPGPKSSRRGELGWEGSLPTLTAVELRLGTGIMPWLALPGSNIPFSGNSDDLLSF